MATPVIMPKQGQSVETCIITKWFKNKGDSVSVNDILFSYETDKAAFDLESTGEGTLLEIFYGEGAEVPVLTNVAVLGVPGESVVPFRPGQAENPDTGSAHLTEQEISSTSEKTGERNIKTISSDGKIRISPRAKLLAQSKGLDYSNLQGSGPNGRIIAGDITKALSGSVSVSPKVESGETEYTEKPLSNVRRLISKAMYTSIQNSAQLTHHMSADVRRLLETRAKIKSMIAAGKDQQDITLNDMICWCVVRALEKFPEANSHFMDETIKTFNRVHLAIAVDTPRGLMVPVVKNADKMNLPQLSAELKKIADSCKKGNISPELLQSSAATFTVSNLGNYGVEMFTPVINLPQAGILGVCTIINRPVNLDDYTIGFVPFIGLSLTYDHRAIDGGPATLFLREIKQQIEKFNFE